MLLYAQALRYVRNFKMLNIPKLVFNSKMIYHSRTYFNKVGNDLRDVRLETFSIKIEVNISIHM